MVQKQKRFIVDKTFTDSETGIEYAQGAIYEVDDRTKPSIEQWMAEGKVRDPDADKAEAEEDDDTDDDDDENDDDEDEPA